MQQVVSIITGGCLQSRHYSPPPSSFCSPTQLLHNRGGQVTPTHHTHLSTVRTGAAAQQEEIGDGIFGNLQVLQLRRKKCVKISKPPAEAEEAICLGACVRCFLRRVGIGGKKLIQTLPPGGGLWVLHPHRPR